MDALLPTFKALADASRLRLLRVLRRGSFNVNELVGIVGMGQSRVSRHLKILLDAGLVVARREGTWMYYTLSERWNDGDRSLATIAGEIAASDELSSFGDDEGVASCLEGRRREAERFFRDVAESFDARRDSVEGPQHYLDDLVSQLDPHGTVVDLGTGTGVLLPRLSKRAGHVVAVDATPEMLAEARRRVTGDRLENVELRLGALEHLPVSDQEADAMVANMVLHHVGHPPDALVEIHRGLRPGGQLLLADLAAHRDESYREKLGDLWLGFQRRDLERWLVEAELELESLERIRASGRRPAILIVKARRRGRRATRTGTTRGAQRRSRRETTA